jgi:hypothetical protein
MPTIEIGLAQYRDTYARQAALLEARMTDYSCIIAVDLASGESDPSDNRSMFIAHQRF